MVEWVWDMERKTAVAESPNDIGELVIIYHDDIDEDDVGFIGLWYPEPASLLVETAIHKTVDGAKKALLEAVYDFCKSTIKWIEAKKEKD